MTNGRSTLRIPLLVAIGLHAAACTQFEWAEKIEESKYRLSDGTIVDKDIGELIVPAYHGRDGGREITIPYVRLRSPAASKAPPVFWLAGGPGIPGLRPLTRKGRFDAVFKRILTRSDLVFFDQRGSGASTPDLVCEKRATYPIGRIFTRPMALSVCRAMIRRCRQKLEARAIDLPAYTTVQNAQDIDVLRQTLGYDQISLFGASYGSHLGLAYIRHFEARVTRALLALVEGPDHIFKRPLQLDQTLANMKPRTQKWIKGVLAKFDQASLQLSVPQRGGGRREIWITDFEFQWRTAQYSGVSFFWLIFRNAAKSNDESDLLLGRLFQRFRSLRLGTAMKHVMDCASGVSPARLALIREQAGRSLFGDALNFPHLDLCSDWGVVELDPAFRSPIRSDRKVLFVSGQFDPLTPPANADEVKQGFPNSRHIVYDDKQHNYCRSEKCAETYAAFLHEGAFPRPGRFDGGVVR